MIMLKVNRKLPMMYKIISRYCNAFQVNPELQETFQSNLFEAFKRNKKSQEIIEIHMIKNEKVFKMHLETPLNSS